MYLEDLSPRSSAEDDNEMVSVGWLDSFHAFPTGRTSPPFRWRLRTLAIHPLNPSKGSHACDFCGKAWGGGAFVFEGPSRSYFCPEMITHYVDEHDYLPPAEFVEAVMSKPKTFFLDMYRNASRGLLD